MKKTLLGILVIGLCAPLPAFADVYMKVSAMNGMGTTETWISGKKQRMATKSPVAQMGDQLEIIRADKGVKWKISHDLKSYEETPIPIPYEADGEPLSSEEAAMEKEWLESMAKTGQAQAQDACSESKKVPGGRTIAGITAEGYQPSCPNQEGPASTIWIAAAGNSKADKIQKELDVFEKAHSESLYSLYPPKEKEKTIKSLELMGTAMSQGLMGMPNVKDMPKRMVLAMEGSGAADDGSVMTMVLFEVLEADTAKAEPSLFEVPAGYTKVSNLTELESQAMMSKFASGEVKMSDLLGGLGNMAAQMGIPMEDETGVEPEPMDPEGVQMLNQMGQASAQMVQTQMQTQGTRLNTQNQTAAPLPTNAPVEPWQQNLYSQQPPAALPAQAPAYGYPPQAQQAAAGQPSYGQQAPGPNNSQQPLNQVQQILGSVQSIAAQFNGGGGFSGFPADPFQQQYEDEYYESEEDYQDQYSDYDSGY